MARIDERGRRRSELTIALIGDTMLGRGVAGVLESAPPTSLLAPEVVAAAREADLVLLNLECCISTRGERWGDPWKPFYFRAPPAAVEALGELGVDCVTLANNHALDFGPVALADTLDYLHAPASRPSVPEPMPTRLGVPPCSKRTACGSESLA